MTDGVEQSGPAPGSGTERRNFLVSFLVSEKIGELAESREEKRVHSSEKAPFNSMAIPMGAVRNGYLLRREGRVRYMRLKQCIGFGYILGVGLFFLGILKYTFVLGANDTLWGTLGAVGGLCIAATLVFPMVWDVPERLFRRAASGIGGALFGTLLIALYFLLFWPVGLVLARLRGRHPFYSWEDRAPEDMEGWHQKTVATIGAEVPGMAKFQHLWKQPFRVIGFFFKRRHYLMIPALVILIALGLILFFVQTSALAPMIYTLF